MAQIAEKRKEPLILSNKTIDTIALLWYMLLYKPCEAFSPTAKKGPVRPSPGWSFYVLAG